VSDRREHPSETSGNVCSRMTKGKRYHVKTQLKNLCIQCNFMKSPQRHHLLLSSTVKSLSELSEARIMAPKINRKLCPCSLKIKWNLIPRTFQRSTLIINLDVQHFEVLARIVAGTWQGINEIPFSRPVIGQN